jgi:hypothetical protein
MDTDRNLLFGVLALQADLIDDAQFARACSEWAGRKQTPLAELLVERGWLTPSDRADVEKLLERKLRKHQGDARASLAAVIPDSVKRSLAGLADADIRQSVAGLTTPPPGPVLVPTTAYELTARDRYTVRRLHATGGIGRVWLARDASLGRDVALKELRPERAGSPVVWARFLKEAQVTGQLEHPGIVPIYELGRRPEDQAPYYTMRFVRGRTLAEAAAAYHQRRAKGEAGPLELRELLTALVGVCHAVAYAHSRGVCNATSSRRTWCWATTARSSCWTGAWPASWARPTTRPCRWSCLRREKWTGRCRGRCSARRRTWRRSRPRGGWTCSARRPTFTAWAPSSTRC